MKMTMEAARINVGLSQKEAADKLGISRDSLRFYEKYKKSPKIDLAFKMVELYKCKIDDIIFLPKDIAKSDKAS